MRRKMIVFLWNVFVPPKFKVFVEIKKIYKSGKSRKFAGEIFLAKKRFHPSKKHLFNSGMVENVPVVNGHFVNH